MVKKEDILALVAGDKVMFPSVGVHSPLLPTNFYEVVWVRENGNRVDIDLRGFMKDSHMGGIIEEERKFHIPYEQFDKGVTVFITRKDGSTNLHEFGDFEI